MNIKFKNVVTSDNMAKAAKVITDYGTLLAPIVLPSIVKILCYKVEESVCYKHRTYTYDDAVKSIIDSDMYSSKKVEAIDEIQRDLNSDTYKAIARIANSAMFSSNKVEAIKKVCRADKGRESND